MIYVLTKPETILEKIRFQLFGKLPATSCDLPRFGPAGVEAVYGDACRIIPAHRIMEIVFEEGYGKALEKVRKETTEHMLEAFAPQPDEPNYSDAEPMKPTDGVAYQ